MNLPKAIETLIDFVKGDDSFDTEDLEAAAQLGIEAIEREQHHRHRELTGIIILLPSETTE